MLTKAILAFCRGFMIGLRGKSKPEPLPFNVADRATPSDNTVQELAVEAAAIHRATEVINKKIAAGEIRDMETLRKKVLEEYSFQKIAIHEKL